MHCAYWWRSWFTEFFQKALSHGRVACVFFILLLTYNVFPNFLSFTLTHSPKEKYLNTLLIFYSIYTTAKLVLFDCMWINVYPQTTITTSAAQVIFYPCPLGLGPPVATNVTNEWWNVLGSGPWSNPFLLSSWKNIFWTLRDIDWKQDKHKVSFLVATNVTNEWREWIEG